MMLLDPLGAIVIVSIVGAIFAVIGWVGPTDTDRGHGAQDFSDMIKGTGRGGCLMSAIVILAILVWWTIVHVKVDIT